MTRAVCFRIVRSLLVVLVLLVGLRGAALAQGGCLSGGTGGCPSDGTPEIDPSLATGGLTLLGGMVLVVRSRRNRG